MYRVVYNTHIGWRRISLIVIMPITAVLTTPPPMQQKGRTFSFFRKHFNSRIRVTIVTLCVHKSSFGDVCFTTTAEERRAGTRQHHDLVQKRTLRILCTTPRRRMLLQKIIFALLFSPDAFCFCSRHRNSLISLAEADFSCNSKSKLIANLSNRG